MKNIDGIDVMGVVAANRMFPMTKELYELKEQGMVPKIKVCVREGGRISATLLVGAIEYFFHDTEDNEGNPLKSSVRGGESLFGEKLKIHEFPFDGWATS